MEVPDKAHVFISHSHGDERLAARLQRLLEDVSARYFTVARSSETSAIKTGENWRDWIDDKILSCDISVVLLTPGSLRGRWVLWESGAVAGVQYQRTFGEDHASSDLAKRRVRVLRFGLGDDVDLGPFGSSQARDGLVANNVYAFVREMLEDYQAGIEQRVFGDALTSLQSRAKEFVDGARQDLRHSPIHATEGVVGEWLQRLERALAEKDYHWVVAARRWINIAFLGIGRADDEQTIDFRIHVLLAEAHRQLGEWPAVATQLSLAAELSPNDLIVLRELGRAYVKLNDKPRASQVMDQMQELDPSIFTTDREGIALRCGFLVEQGDWPGVATLLSSADQGLVTGDPYLANWRALGTMQAHGPDASLPHFRALGQRLLERGSGFWDDATLVNALLATGDLETAEARLRAMQLSGRPQDMVDSATKYFDDILVAFGRAFDWRQVAGL